MTAITLTHAAGVSAEMRSVRCDRGANLQRAIDRAEPGDRLVIRGTCRGHFVVTKRLVLVGADRESRLHGGGSGTVLLIRDDPPFGEHSGFNARVTRLTVARGELGIGVGEYNVRADLSRVTILRNGVGIDVHNSAAVVRRSVVRSNGPGCAMTGGGITLIDTVVRDNRGSGACPFVSHLSALASTIRDNKGWGIEGGSSIDLQGSVVRGNAMGGILGHGVRSIRITDSRLAGNRTDGSGGAIRIFEPHALGDGLSRPLTIFNSTIRGNVAGEDGGGIFVRYGDPSRFEPVYLQGVTFKSNRAGEDGGAIYSVDAPVQLFDVVFEDNEPDDCVGC